jgi:hypothetical protein
MTNLVKELESLLNNNISPSMFPVKKGNIIKVDKFDCMPTKYGYRVFDTKQQKNIAETFTKTAALALAKCCSANKNYNKKILELDKIIEKHYNDCVFYKNTLRKSTDTVKLEMTRTRFDISRHITKDAKRKLDLFLLR